MARPPGDRQDPPPGGQPGRVPDAEIALRLRWAMTALETAGLRVDAPLTPLHKAWSVVVPIRTAQGLVFLKYVRGAFAQEPGLTRALSALASTLASPFVPGILAADAALACWLVRDGGRDIPPDELLADSRLPALLRAHAGLQRATLGARADWLSLGARDVSPDRWPQFLAGLRAARAALEAGKVSQPVLTGLAAAERPLDRLAQRLAALAPPDCVVHMDLRAVNVKSGRDGLTLIDWGDAGVGPAFLDPVPLLAESAARDPAAARRLADAVLAPWTDLHDLDTLREMQAICRVGFPLLYAHGLVHARPGTGPPLPPATGGLLNFYLETFLARLAAAT